MDKKYFIDIKTIFPLLISFWNAMGSALATQGESKEYFPRELFNVKQFLLTRRTKWSLERL